MKKIYVVLYSITVLLVQHSAVVSKTTHSYIGSVQFPSSVTYVDPVRVFCKGQVLPIHTHDSGKKISFTLQAPQDTSVFYLLITSAQVRPVKVRKMAADVIQNTIAYLKINPKNPYKFYKMTVVADVQTVEDLSGKKKKKNLHTWRVEERKLPQTGRIPDEAIIIPLNAQWVKKVAGGSSVGLPRIIIKDDIVPTKESEKMLHEEMTRALLASLDVGTLHVPVRQETRGDIALKTIVAMAA